MVFARQEALPFGLHLGRGHDTSLDEGSNVGLVSVEPMANVLWKFFRGKALGAGIGQYRAYAVVGRNKDEACAVGASEKVALRKVCRGSIDHRLQQKVPSNTLCHQVVDRLGTDSGNN